MVGGNVGERRMMSAIRHGVRKCLCVFLVCEENTKNKEERKIVNGL